MREHSADYPAIDAEINRTAGFKFGPYLGWITYTFPDFLRELSRKYPAPDLAYLHFRQYADAAIERTQAQSHNSIPDKCSE